jgi:hypothetical protein
MKIFADEEAMRFLLRLAELENLGMMGVRRNLWSPDRRQDRARQRLCRDRLAEYVSGSRWQLTEGGRAAVEEYRRAAVTPTAIDTQKEKGASE